MRYLSLSAFRIQPWISKPFSQLNPTETLRFSTLREEIAAGTFSTVATSDWMSTSPRRYISSVSRIGGGEGSEPAKLHAEIPAGRRPDASKVAAPPAHAGGAAPTNETHGAFGNESYSGSR